MTENERKQMGWKISDKLRDELKIMAIRKGEKILELFVENLLWDAVNSFKSGK